MRRMMVFAARNRREILRDPLTLCFALLMPLALLGLMTAIQNSVPVEIFALPKLTPGIAVFSLSFITLFSGILIAKDRSTAFSMRLFVSPLSSSECILGYCLPLLPIAMLQAAACFLLALCLGLTATPRILLSLLVMIPAALLYIAFGLLFGVLFNDKQVGGFFSIFVNVTTWLSGIWFDLSLIGGAFSAISYALPFVHAVDAAHAALAGDYGEILPHLLYVFLYTAAAFAAAVLLFRRKRRS